MATGDDIAPAHTLTLGSISSRPLEEDDLFRPFAAELASRLAAHGFTAGDVIVASSTSEMAELLRTERVDVYLDSPLAAARVASESAVHPLLRRWKDGVSEYRSVLFTRADSGVTSLADLRGRTLAFESRHSTAGYLVAKALLLHSGERLVELERPDAPVPDDSVGFVFSGDDENSVQWVLSGRLSGSAMSRLDFESLAGPRRGELKVVLESRPVPRHVVMVRDGLKPELVTALEYALLGMHLDRAGQIALHAFDETARFDRFPGGAAPTFEYLNRLGDLLREEHR